MLLYTSTSRLTQFQVAQLQICKILHILTEIILLLKAPVSFLAQTYALDRTVTGIGMIRILGSSISVGRPSNRV